MKNNPSDDFDLDLFLPYLLNQAAEVTSQNFQAVYKAEYGMTRTQWRIMANLGREGLSVPQFNCWRSKVRKPFAHSAGQGRFPGPRSKSNRL
jgi:hypothetical protein